jgi:hypothetical protein
VGSIQNYFTWKNGKQKNKESKRKGKKEKGKTKGIKLRKKMTIKGRRYKEKSSG